MRSFLCRQLFHEIRRFDTRSPDHQIRLNVLAIFGVQTAKIGTGDQRGLRQNTQCPFWSARRGAPEIRGGNAGRIRSPASDLRHVQCIVGQPFITVAVKLFYRIVQLSRQFNACRPATDNRDIHFAVPPRLLEYFRID